MNRSLMPLVLLSISSGVTLAVAAPGVVSSGTSQDGEVVMEDVESEAATFRVVRVVDGLEHPWAVDWLPDGRTLLTERGGALYLVDDGQVTALSNCRKCGRKTRVASWTWRCHRTMTRAAGYILATLFERTVRAVRW